LNLLALDTSSPWLILGTLKGNETFIKTSQPLASHGEEIFKHIDGILVEAGLRSADLDGCVVGSGPGSFTGTRVGWAAVLGWAEGLGIPAVSISTLDALGWMDLDSGVPGLAVLDARRGKFYAAVYVKGKRLGKFLDLDPLKSGNLPLRVIGPQAKDFIQAAGGGGWQAVVVSSWAPGLLALGADKLKHGESILAGEGPVYLRPYIDTLIKKT